MLIFVKDYYSTLKTGRVRLENMIKHVLIYLTL